MGDQSTSETEDRETFSDDKTGRQNRLRHFTLILAGQMVSVFGSSLTSFALGVWAFQTVGSFTIYSLIFFADSFMTAITSPIAGIYVDRWDKKKVLLFSSVGSALISGLITVLYFLDSLEAWQIIIIAGINGSLIAFSRPAIIAAIKILIHPDDLARANGLTESGFGITALLTPLIAGFLMVNIELFGILIIDLVSFAIGIVTLTYLRLPIKKLAPSEPLWESLKSAWNYLKGKSALLWLVGFYFMLNLVTSGVIVLIQPLILSFSDASGLGIILTTAGFGYLVGAIIIAQWGGPERKIYAIYVSTLSISIGIAIVPLFTDVFMVSIGGFLLAMGVPVSLACNKTIIQQKVHTTFIGKVEGLGIMLISISFPLGYIFAGPIAQEIFEPLLLQPTASNQLLGEIYGFGKGRGIAFMISCMAAFLFVIVIGAIINPKIRRIESDLPNEE